MKVFFRGECQRENHIVHPSLIHLNKTKQKKLSAYYVPAQQSFLKNPLKTDTMQPHSHFQFTKSLKDFPRASPGEPESMCTATEGLRGEGGFHYRRETSRSRKHGNLATHGHHPANFMFLLTIYPYLLLLSLITWLWGQGTIWNSKIQHWWQTYWDC